MTEQELTKGLVYLGSAYGKEYNKVECEQHYDFLNEYSYETFVKAIKNIIKKSKFLPKISDIIEECENCKEQVKHDVIEFMLREGYFKKGDYGELSDAQALKNYEKAISFIEKDIVPKWLQEDINHYYKLMKQEKLEYQEQKLLG